MFAVASDVQSFLHAPRLSVLTPREILQLQVMERITKRASMFHADLTHTVCRPISWDGILYRILKTSGLGDNVNFHLEREGEQIADFDIQASVYKHRWNLWHRIVGEDADDMRFRHRGHGSRVLHCIELYLYALWAQRQYQGPPHEIICSTDRDDVKGLLNAHHYEEIDRGCFASRTFRKTVL